MDGGCIALPLEGAQLAVHGPRAHRRRALHGGGWTRHPPPLGGGPLSRRLDPREEVVLVCRRLYERGLIAGAEGNVSVRITDDVILATPAGVAKVDVEPDDLITLAPDGTVRRAGRGAGRGAGRASTEIRMHLRIYARRPDLRAVVHAHPPTATGFAVAGQGLVAPVHPEIIFQLGAVPLVPYGTPGTAELPDRMEPYLADYSAWLLANHGVTAAGPTLAIAHQRMEAIEAAARIELTARLLGCVNTLDASQVQALLATRSAPPAEE